MLDLTLGDEVANRAGHVLDRYVRIDPMLVQQVDGFDAEPLQGAFDGLANVLRPAVHSANASRLRVDVEAELRRDHDVVTERAQRFPDHLFILEGSVDFGGVEEGHTSLEGVADQLDAVLLRKSGAITLADTHAAEADGRNVEAAPAEFTGLHSQSFPNFAGRRLPRRVQAAEGRRLRSASELRRLRA